MLRRCSRGLGGRTGLPGPQSPLGPPPLRPSSRRGLDRNFQAKYCRRSSPKCPAFQCNLPCASIGPRHIFPAFARSRVYPDLVPRLIFHTWRIAWLTEEYLSCRHSQDVNEVCHFCLPCAHPCGNTLSASSNRRQRIFFTARLGPFGRSTTGRRVFGISTALAIAQTAHGRGGVYVWAQDASKPRNYVRLPWVKKLAGYSIRPCCSILFLTGARGG